MPGTHAPARRPPPPPPRQPPPRVMAAATAHDEPTRKQPTVAARPQAAGAYSELARLTRAVHLSGAGVYTVARDLAAYKDTMNTVKVALSTLRDVLQTSDSVVCSTSRSVDADAALTFARTTRTTIAAQHQRREAELARMPEAALVVAELEEGKELRCRQQQQLSQLPAGGPTHVSPPRMPGYTPPPPSLSYAPL